jgi:hypothetical protein
MYRSGILVALYRNFKGGSMEDNTLKPFGVEYLEETTEVENTYGGTKTEVTSTMNGEVVDHGYD